MTSHPPRRKGRDGCNLAAAGRRGRRDDGRPEPGEGGAGRLPTPPHSHGASEELYFVLAGDGLAWQDDAVHEVRPGDCVIHRPNELEHTFVAGDGPRVPGVRYAASDRDRLAAAIAGDPLRLAVGRGAGRRSLGCRGAVAAAGGGRAGRPTAEHPERRRGGARGHGARRVVGAAGDPRAQRPIRPALGAAGAGGDRIASALPLRGGGAVRDPRRIGDARAVALAGRRDARRRPGGHRDPSRATWSAGRRDRGSLATRSAQDPRA